VLSRFVALRAEMMWMVLPASLSQWQTNNNLAPVLMPNNRKRSSSAEWSWSKN
jgi:hypothetical protein